MVKPANLLIIMSDEHNPKVMGCAGHPIVKTPNIDALAARGTMFTSAYTTCPVCVPARAAFAVGQYVHRIGFWDNADAYDGSIPSWHHRLRENGHRVVSIGKLHFRGHEGDDNGFSEEIIPMNIIEGKGDLMGLVRKDLPERGLSWKIAKLAGPGETPYTAYDREITTRAQIWLREEAPRHRDKPWVLFVSFVCPHFPLVAPADFYYRYRLDRMPLPKQYAKEERPDHPYLRDYAGSFVYDRYFDSDRLRKAVAAYYGLCSFLDDNIGRVLRTLKAVGLALVFNASNRSPSWIIPPRAQFTIMTPGFIVEIACALIRPLVSGVSGVWTEMMSARLKSSPSGIMVTPIFCGRSSAK